MPRRSLAEDDRGLALAIVIFFAMLIIAALLYAVMGSGMDLVFNIAENSSTHTGADDQIARNQAIWNNLMFAMLVLSMVFLIARAVREGRR